MSIYEYNEEYVKKTLYEDGYDAGVKQGVKQGIKQGVEAIKLVENITDLMQNQNIDLLKACESLGITVEDYQIAKDKLNSLL